MSYNYICIFFIFVVLKLMPLQVFGANRQQVLASIEGIYSPTIETVQFYREGWEMSMPILSLNSDQHLVLNFDDVSDDSKSLVYTITRYESDWSPSRLMINEYLDGFQENTITDFAFSSNTEVSYVNYLLIFPNDDVKIKLSGNYLLTVWDTQNRSHPLFTRCFYVCDNKVSINGEIQAATMEGFKGKKQEVPLTINIDKLRVQDPHSEITTFITQNRRKDCVKKIFPTYIKSGELIYDDHKTNVFDGSNEFRQFDLKNLRTTGYGIARLEYVKPYTHALIKLGKIRGLHGYSFFNDLNGMYFIKNEEMDDSDLESDYVLSHFVLQLPRKIVGGGIYIFGKLTDWNIEERYRMKYDPSQNVYKTDVLLKQGIYDYVYVYLPDGENQILIDEYEGSFFETSNSYQVFVYYKGIGDRYDQLVGVKTIGSEKEPPTSK